MLVPEIALTPALAASCRRAFGARVAIQHSGSPTASGTTSGSASAAARWTSSSARDRPCSRRSSAWGSSSWTRSTTRSYKQEESPRYHGRDVAIVRAQRAGALVVLGSATPSMESYHHASTGRYERVVARAPRAGSAAGRRDDRGHAGGIRRSGPRRDPEPGPGRGPRGPRSSGGSRRSCCSTGAGSRPRCSAASARARSTVPTAACRSSCTGRAPRAGRAATTATTR